MTEAEANVEAVYSIVILQLITRRHELGLSQEQVDMRLDKSSRTAKWESLVRVPTLKSLVMWCEALDLEFTLVMKHPTKGPTNGEITT